MRSGREIDVFSEFERKRIIKIVNQYLDEYKLDLGGLVIYTEAASGYYLFTPLICAMAGAKKVYALTRDSSWGKAEEIKAVTNEFARLWNLDGAIEVVLEKYPEHISQSDIIANLGFVRPIDTEMISWMKETAVIPLMWETWEFRPAEIDLGACKEAGILVMGTDEHKIDFIKYAAYLVWKILFEYNIEIYKNKFFIFTSDPLAKIINEIFYDNKIEYSWTSFDECIENQYKPFFINRNDKESILTYISQCDVVICEEKSHNKCIIGDNGIITPIELRNANDSILLILRSGVVDYKRMKELGIEIYPDSSPAMGHSTVCSYHLGPRTALELNIAGLKVGEAMARARLSGLSLRTAAIQAMKYSPAMDFQGDLSWIENASL